MIKLSILIPTLPNRAEFLNRLLSILKPQLTNEVEVVVESDDGKMSIGEKRNKLLERAIGEYICFIDDDDRVSDDYISELMVGVNKKVDVVSIRGELTTNGAQLHKFVDRPYTRWVRLPDGTYLRGVQHLDAIKREIASKFKFPLKNFAEDQEWGQQIEASKLVTSYHSVTKLIYFYDYRNDKAQSYSIVIPSATANNLLMCVKGIMTGERGILPSKIIVVDDGARNWSEGSLPAGITWVTGKKPFNYARNINLGLREVGHADDVILLNDDAVLRNLGGFSSLVKASHEYGLVSAATNIVGNPNQMYRGVPGIRPEGRTLAFVCVCIPKAVLDVVGGLDERFTAYGGEDNDYCLRTRISGFKLGVFDGCFVDHMSGKQTFHRDIAEGQEIYRQKWGAGYGEIPKMPPIVGGI